MTTPVIDLRQSLHDIFGFKDFRYLQEEAINATLSGHDALVVMPTGAGKSLCFQLPAALSPGVTLVISPLVALMRDQVIGLRARSTFDEIGCAYLNSLQTADEQRETLDQLRNGALKLVYVAPERFRSAGFRSALLQAKVARFVVDEAHCISEWGHDFRPDYLALRPAIEDLGRPPILAVTATATLRVQESIVRNLGMDVPEVLVGGFDRPNLHFSVVRCSNDAERNEKLVRALPKLCAAGGSGLIYVSTRKQCEEIGELAARALAPLGKRAAGYHAGMSADVRNELQNGWLNNDLQILVATNAFGMGIDKPDVRFVIHYGIPDSLENYYQEAGRAGRDGRKSRCVVMYRGADKRVREFFIERDNIEADDVQKAFTRLKKLADEDGFVIVPRVWWRSQFDWDDTRVRLILRELEKENCVERELETPDESHLRVLKDKFPASALRRIRQDFEVQRNEKLRRLNEMVDYCRTNNCRRQTVLDYFGDDEKLPDRAFCCDNCDNPPAAKSAAAGAAPREWVKTPDTIDGGDIYAILQGIDALKPQVGKARLNKVLRGAASKDVQIFRDQNQPLLGACKGCSNDKINEFLDALIEHGLLHQGEEDEYFVCSLTRAGREAWQLKSPLPVEAPRAFSRGSSSSSGAAKAGYSGTNSRSFAGDFEDAADESLFERLRDWRKATASAAKVPAYCVLPDRTLGEIAACRPTSLEQLEQVNGIGPTKIEKYGASLLQVLAGEKSSAKKAPQVLAAPKTNASKALQVLAAAKSAPQVLAAPKTAPVIATATALIKDSPSMEETRAMIRQALNVEQIAAQRGLTTSTVWSHLHASVELELLNADDLTQVLDTKTRDEINAALQELGADTTLSPLHQQLNGAYEYGLLRCALALYRRQVAA